MTPEDEVEQESNESKTYALGKLFSSVEEYNKGHGEGGALGRMFSGMVRSAGAGVEEPDMTQVTQSAAIEGTQTAHEGLTTLKSSHRAVLDAFGLTLVHQPSPDPERPTSDLMLVKVLNPKILAERIKTITPGSETEKGEVLKKLLGHVEQQIRTLDFDALEPEGDKFLGGLGEIVTALKGGDATLPVSSLERYAKFQREGRLGNYLAVEREGLWVKPGEGFGPADWVGDATPERLDQMWTKAIAILHLQERDGHGVGTELKEHLLVCISASSERITRLETEGSINTDYKKTLPAMRTVLMKHTQALVGGAVN